MIGVVTTILLLRLYPIIPIVCSNADSVDSSSLHWPLYHELYSSIVKSSSFVSGDLSDRIVNVSEIILANGSDSDVCDRNYSYFCNSSAASSSNFISNFFQNTSYLSGFGSGAESIDCLADLYYFAESIRKMDQWALKVADAYGKIPAGLYTGNVIWAGNYDECREVNAPVVSITFHVGPIRYTHDASFTGQYCMLQVISDRSPTPPVPEGYLLEGLTIGICSPKRCTDKMLSSIAFEVGKAFNKTLSKAGVRIAGVSCPRTKTYLDDTAILAIVVLLVLLLLVIIGTSYETYVICNRRRRNAACTASRSILDDVDVAFSEHQQQETDDYEDKTLSTDGVSYSSGNAERILTCFSLITNIKRLFSLSSSSSKRHSSLDAAAVSYKDLTCLHGIRFLSMAWIILGHTYYFSFAVSSDPLDRLDPNKRDFWFQAIIQAAYACDTFFVISACLVATQFFLVADQYPQVVGTCRFWITFYLQRLVRITPPYMLILCVYIGLWKYVGGGPFWPEEGFEVNNCRLTWWTNLLFVNNLINMKAAETDGTGSKREYCAGWTWYFAADMQMYLISPLVLYPIFKRRQNIRFSWLGYFALAALFIGGIGVTGIIARVNELPPNMFPADLNLRDKAQFMKDELYFKPYPHAPCYAVGLILALALRRHWQKGQVVDDDQQQQQRRRRLRQILVVIGWSLSFSFAMAVIYGLWPQYRGHPFSVDLSACYVATSRAVFSACVAWVAYACLTGNGGIVNRFLSCPIFKPLNRLTFCAYLIHPMLLLAYFFTRRTTFYYTEFVMVWYFGSFLLFSYLAAIGVALVFESPFLTLNRRFVKRVE